QHQRLRQEVDAIANPDGQIPGPSGAALHAGGITALGERFHGSGRRNHNRLRGHCRGEKHEASSHDVTFNTVRQRFFYEMPARPSGRLVLTDTCSPDPAAPAESPCGATCRGEEQVSTFENSPLQPRYRRDPKLHAAPLDVPAAIADTRR